VREVPKPDNLLPPENWKSQIQVTQEPQPRKQKIQEGSHNANGPNYTSLAGYRRSLSNQRRNNPNNNNQLTNSEQRELLELLRQLNKA
jgi:hypothetical protein